MEEEDFVEREGEEEVYIEWDCCCQACYLGIVVHACSEIPRTVPDIMKSSLMIRNTQSVLTITLVPIF